MDLTWYGLGCFRLTERGYPAIVTDPFDESEAGLELPRPKVDIVTTSRLIDNPHDVRWPGLPGVSRTLAGPGEYEIGGVFITGVASSRTRKRGADLPEEQNIIYTVNYDSVTVCHLGKLGRAPTQAQIEEMGRVNVLLIPVGIPEGMTDTMISETISAIEPDIVIPMQYKTPGLTVERGTVTGFLKEMGVSEPTTLSSLRITSGQEAEETQVILLEPR